MSEVPLFFQHTRSPVSGSTLRVRGARIPRARNLLSLSRSLYLALSHRGSALRAPCTASCLPGGRERHFFTDNLLVRIYLIIEMIVVDRPCAMGV